MRKLGTIVWLAAVGGIAAGCGPTLSTQVRLETVKAPDNTGSVSKDGLVVEIPESKSWVQQFVVSAATCTADGTPAKDPISGGPIMKDIAITAPGTSIYQVKMTNQTDHIIRLQGSVIRLFDPADNQIEPEAKDEAFAAAARSLGERGICPMEVSKLQGAFATLKFIGANTELLPGTTTSGFLFFVPPTIGIPGVWKLSMYELPVKVDAAGTAVAKTRFDFAYVVKKYEDTFTQQLMGPKTLVSSKEVP